LPDARHRELAGRALIVLLIVVGVAMRVNNAYRYNVLWGFDARYNWDYIVRLLYSWELPAPDAAWSTAHPPLFYYLSAALCRAFGPELQDGNIILVRLVSSLLGLAAIALTVAFVRRLDPEDRLRAVLAGALLLFLPVHIYMSAMLSEEILATALISVVLVGFSWSTCDGGEQSRSPWLVAGLGVVAGLALLTKLTGLLLLLAVCGSLVLDGMRRGNLRGASLQVALFATVMLLVGGWFFVRNLIGWGYLYPYGLEVHQMMFTMPPGERHVSDFLRIPLATLTDPSVLNADLLRSVWGSTYVTMWFDGQRHFLPRKLPSVTYAGSIILTLALLPMAAFFTGLVRGARRMIRSPGGPDTLFLLMIGATLAGYCLFAWRNPWFAVLKASFMLGLCVPFAFYASEVLSSWLRLGGIRSALTWAVLSALLVGVVCTFTFAEVFWSTELMWKAGVDWEPVE
jgi:hypothetical protein